MCPPIAKVRAIETIDSRGFPTLRAFVTLQNGATASASVPTAGDSAGPKELTQHRDGASSRYGGQGLQRAAASVTEVISPALEDIDPCRQDEIDRLLLELQNDPAHSAIGPVATLGVSMAVARTAAAAERVPLYRHLGGTRARRLPLPMINVLNGGAHADNNIDLEEFMIVPVGAASFAQAIQWGSETFHALHAVLRKRRLLTTVGDEGGFAPTLSGNTNEQSCELIVEAIESAGYRPGTDVALAIDAAAAQLFDGTQYQLRWSGQKPKSRDDMLGMYGGMIWRFPIVALEDGLAANDWLGSRTQTSLFGWKIQTVGDDIYATDSRQITEGVRQNATNAVVIRLSQVGTVTQALDATRVCRDAGWAPIVAASQGDTEDSFVSDFAVAAGCPQIKAGSVCRGERVAKYNRLLQIEQELGPAALFETPLQWKPWREAAKDPQRRR